MKKKEISRRSKINQALFGSVTRKIIIFSAILVLIVIITTQVGINVLERDLEVGLVMGGVEQSVVDQALTDVSISGLVNSLIIIGIIIVGIAYFLRTFSKPLKQIEKASEKLKAGNFDIDLNIDTGDEIEKLANTLTEAGNALKRTEQERRQIDRAKTEFLSITSHELRSPMTPMQAQLEMLMRGYFGKVTTKQQESLDIILNNAKRLDRILLDFLEVSRIEAARLKFKFQETNITIHIKRLIEEMKAFLPEKNIKLVPHLGELPEKMKIDPDRVMQVLRNLINNAKKFTPPNGIIHIYAEQKEDFIQFAVQDSGIGISEVDQRRIFEPFYQVEHTLQRSYHGTGLGLAICKGIVESQNGKMWIRSIQGEGSTFLFTIPIKPVKETKPIKVLFSSQGAKDQQVHDLFSEFLGPIGLIEFEELRGQGMDKSLINFYIKDLKKKGILDEDQAKLFKAHVREIYSPKKKTKADKSIAQYFG